MVALDFATATSQASLEQLLAFTSRAPMDSVEVTALRAGGAAISAALRDELLAKVHAGEHVEIDVDILAYEQKPGVYNRKFIRVRDGAMTKLGRSGKGKPFLRDHEQGDVNARAGTITSSETEKKLTDGHYAIKLTARFTAPWAVELALRGLLSFVSIGLSRGDGQILCSACNSPVFANCWHIPGDRLAEKIGDDGVKRKLRDRSGPITVEWIFTDPVMDECSVCSVPAVESAHIEGIRAALSAHPGFRAEPAPHAKDGTMNLLAMLNCSSEAEAIKAVESLRADRDAARAELAIARSDLAAAQQQLSNVTVDSKKLAEDKFIGDAVATGRIGLWDEANWRALYAAAPDTARKLMGERPANCATPLGAPRQRDNDPEPAGRHHDAATAHANDQIHAYSQGHASFAGVAHVLERMGIKDPRAAIAKHLGTEKP